MKLMAQRMRRILALTLIVAPVFTMLGSPLRANETTTTTSTTTSTTTPTTTSSTSTTSTTTTSSSTTSSTSSTSSTSTTAPSGGHRITGGRIGLLQLSENQFQVRFYYTKSESGCMPQGNFSESWSVSPAPDDPRAQSSGGRTWSSMGMCGSEWDSGDVANVWGLRAGTTYTITYTGGYPGNTVSSSRAIKTNGEGWQTTTTTTTDPVVSTSSSLAATTTTMYSDPPLYMARIDSDNRVLEVCVCSEAFVRANPSRYPGRWVPAWMGVNGKNYPGPGWTYDPAVENFYPPTTTTTSTSSTSTSTTVVVTSTSSDDESTSGAAVPSVTEPTASTTTAVERGDAVVEVGGEEVIAESRVSENGIQIVAGDVVANVSRTDDSAVPTSETDESDGSVFLAGDEVEVVISGLAPGSNADVVIYSEPRSLGQLVADSAGRVSGTVEIPKDMPAGSHTIVVSGLDVKGELVEVKFGVMVVRPGSVIPTWMWGLVALLVAALGVSLSRQHRVRRPESLPQ